ncbi:hypothetical protein [Helicobacter bizzozeronii]|uniref:hypothetical protein n=1 Tax=Helicobacter bizzozeronii TaxID=56877 RepID=UPI0013158234|nr:hypothetical protein [Helicobacter bizzozeronii]
MHFVNALRLLIKAYATLGGLMPRLNATHCLFSYLLARLTIKMLTHFANAMRLRIKRSTGRWGFRPLPFGICLPVWVLKC